MLQRADFEVEGHEREDKALEVLHDVVEGAEAVGVVAALDVDEGANFGGGEGHMFGVADNFELLAADLVGLGPVGVIAVEHAAIVDDALHFGDDSVADEGFFPYDALLLVLSVVCIPQLLHKSRDAVQ